MVSEEGGREGGRRPIPMTDAIEHTNTGMEGAIRNKLQGRE